MNNSYHSNNNTNLNLNYNSSSNSRAQLDSNTAQPQATKPDDIFQIAAKAEKLLQEILSSSSSNIKTLNLNAHIKQEPVVVQPTTPQPVPQQPQYYQQAYHHVSQPNQYIYHGAGPGQILVDPSFYAKHPPPIINQPPPFYYQQQPSVYYQSHPSNVYQSASLTRPPVPYQYVQPAPVNYSSYSGQFNKRKFSDINNNRLIRPSSSSSSTTLQHHHHHDDLACDGEEDLNIIRERELKDLKCKSVIEKMNVFLKYYKQFKDSYIHRVQTLECSDSLKMQFNSLIKYLNEYDQVLFELNSIIIEHEREYACKNNHRKTKKFFNKSKAFIRYECSKRLQSNIFEYRRLINSQDRYAGMYDLLDMNNYLISLLPDIGVSIRRYINRCEKAKQEEENEDDDYANWNSDNSVDSGTNEKLDTGSSNTDGADLTIPTFKEFLSQNVDDTIEKDTSEIIQHKSGSFKNYESYSKGIDSLNRYLLKRVDEEESLDELVKERIIKWINKRQAKYILIFSEVDKLLNQHKAGECYSKFHSYLLFNLGKLVTVCDSYHQKLKELLYSTTIRRKKKRKKVKILPEAMTDVFDEINDLKKSLEYGKHLIKKCNFDLKASGSSGTSSTNGIS